MVHFFFIFHALSFELNLFFDQSFLVEIVWHFLFISHARYESDENRSTESI